MAKEQPAAEERREGARTLNQTQIAKAEEHLAEIRQPATVPQVETPKGLQPIGAAEASELFFAKPEDQQSQRAVIDRTAYGAEVVHRY